MDVRIKSGPLSPPAATTTAALDANSGNLDATSPSVASSTAASPNPRQTESTSNRHISASQAKSSPPPPLPTSPSAVTSPQSPVRGGDLGLGAVNRFVTRSTSNLKIDNQPWTLQEIGQNHIASLLNDPTISGSSSAMLAHKLDTVTKQALAAIPKSQIKPIKTKDFENYLSRIKDAYDHYVEILNQNTPSSPEDFNYSIPIDNELDPSKQQASGSFGPKFTTASKIAADPVESIPKIFFETDFNLENPQIFDQVTEFANVTSATPAIGSYQPVNDSQGRSPDTRKPTGILTTNTILQEKLSHYMDTVEVHLVAEISKRSVEFFSALSNIQSLHKETIQCLSNIRTIRSSLAKVSEEQAKKGLVIVRKKTRNDNFRRLLDALSLVKEVKKTQPMIQILLSQGDYVGSLDLIAQTNRLLKGVSPIEKPLPVVPGASSSTQPPPKTSSVPLIDLNGIRGLVHLSGQLVEMSKMIGNLMENDLAHLLSEDLNSFVSKVINQSHNYSKWARSVLFEGDQNSVPLSPTSVLARIFSKEDFEAEEELKLRITPLIYGLVRTEKLSVAVQTHKDNVIKCIKLVTKQYFPPPLPSDDKNISEESSLARRFRALTFDEFFKILVSIFSVLLQILRRASFIYELFSLILKESEKNGIIIGSDKVSVEDGAGAQESGSKIGDVSKTASPKYSQLIGESSDVILSAAEYAHVRCGKLLTLRAEQNSQLNFKDFFKLFDLCWRFVTVGENICQRTCVGLRGTVMSQARSFLNYFHMERMKQIVLLIDHEQWNQAEVPIDFQKMVNKISGSAIDLHLVRAPTGNERDEEEKEKEKPPAKTNMLIHLTVDDKAYVVVSCVLLLVKMIEEYMVCIEQVPSMAPDVLNRLVEILKIFNTRTCSIVVGGAAVLNQVLKSITAKHLALAGQSLGFVCAIIPFLRKTIEVTLPRQQKLLVAELDKVIKDYESNIDQVFRRITMIMSERLQIQCEAMVSVKWDSDKPADSPLEPNVYIRELVKDTQKLYRILKRFLFNESIKMIFADILQMYFKRLEQDYSKVEIYTIAGKNQMLADVQFYIANLSSLDGVDGPGNQLEVVVNNVRIRERMNTPLTRLAPPARPHVISPNTSAAVVTPDISASTNAPAIRLTQPASSLRQTLQIHVANAAPANIEASSADPVVESVANVTTAGPPAIKNTFTQQPVKPILPQETSKTTTPNIISQPLATSNNQNPSPKAPVANNSAAQSQAATVESAAKKLGSAFSTGLGNLGKFMSKAEFSLKSGVGSNAASTPPQPPPSTSSSASNQSKK